MGETAARFSNGLVCLLRERGFVDARDDRCAIISIAFAYFMVATAQELRLDKQTAAMAQ